MRVKGSFTIEATVIMIIFMSIISVTMNMGLEIYNEITSTHEEERRQDLWFVDDFYRYQLIDEVVND